MTLEEVWNTKVERRFMPIYLRGKRIKDKYIRKQLQMRLDSVFCRDGYCGNDFSLVEAVRNSVYMPITKNGTQEEIDKLQEWFDYWGSDCSNDGYGLFTIDLISSCYCGGPRSWFNPKNGKIKGYNIMEDMETLGELKEEIEWFAKGFPDIDLYLYFVTTPYSSDEIPNIVLHLYDTKIEVVENKHLRKFKDGDKKIGYYPQKPPLKFRILWNIYKYLRKFNNLPTSLNNKIITFCNVDRLIAINDMECYYSYDKLKYLVHWWDDNCRCYEIYREEENKE